ALQKLPQNTFMTIDEFNTIYSEVTSFSAFDLSKRMDISIDYAYLMLPSVMIYKKIIALTGAQRLMVPGVTLADGMVSEYALDNKLVRFDHDFNADIISAVRSIAGRYRSNQKHARSLEYLSLAIFDSMKKLHGLTRKERLLLQLSCILHDIGKFVSMSDQADCSYYIIMSTEIIGLSTAERRTLANVVKYYHEDFDYEVLQDEGVERRNVVAKLVAILKVAGVLDRSHKQKIGSIRCDIKDEKLVITSDTPNDLTLEQLMLPSRADFFEEVYGIRPVLRKKRVTTKN
ncbi:MAG: HD domain-containing protein, partial [Lachnospiraceae bacterium]